MQQLDRSYLLATGAVEATWREMRWVGRSRWLLFLGFKIRAWMRLGSSQGSSGALTGYKRAGVYFSGFQGLYKVLQSSHC